MNDGWQMVRLGSTQRSSGVKTSLQAKEYSSHMASPSRFSILELIENGTDYHGDDRIEVIQEEEESQIQLGGIRGYQPPQGGPNITHLLFADDIRLIVRAQKRMLGYCSQSGQWVNMNKFQICFGRRVRQSTKQYILNLFRVPLNKDVWYYLRVPLSTSSLSSTDFSPLVNQIHKKLEGWKWKHLSQVGRLTLLQSVLSAVPDVVCSPKREGGLGLQALNIRPQALLAKAAGNLVLNRSSLWAQLMSSKYRFSIWSEYHPIRGASNLWRFLVRTSK
ncbi:uncharacterized protein [Elaeis guineensis]|uniref:uncharacterized protein n=1 Tax=Elaeis guineensis var. tenera TaxID=51953 RepID=UPI003C6DB783